ncbi:MAG: FKBP-type peptidyl-prolyl cis-trans isomerase [Bacteroidota bacterium]
MRKIQFCLLPCFFAVILSGCFDSDDDFFDSNAQYQEDLQTIDAFLASNGISAQVDDVTGIRFVINNVGTGLQPYVADSLTVSYVGKVLADESTFETVENEKRSVGSLLQGIITSITKIREGGSVTAYVPSLYGFGNVEGEGVPANSPLIYEIEFHALHSQRLFGDFAEIDTSLDNRGINPEIHPSGIRFVLEQGSGPSPSINSNVTVTYEARLLGTSEAVDAGQSRQFSLQGLILAWQIMIPEIQQGGDITIYVPSSFAYGSRGQGEIPPNANLEFDIELIQVD